MVLREYFKYEFIYASGSCFRGVVVIACALHAQGPQFDPGRKQYESCVIRLGSETCQPLLIRLSKSNTLKKRPIKIHMMILSNCSKHFPFPNFFLHSACYLFHKLTYMCQGNTKLLIHPDDLFHDNTNKKIY